MDAAVEEAADLRTFVRCPGDAESYSATHFSK